MIRVITMSREYGSGGSLIARQLAERLDWKLVDDPFVEEIAKAAKVDPALARRYDECCDPWFYRLVKTLWRGGYEGVATRVEPAEFDADAMAALWTRVIHESAQIGHCVIVGRGGQCILRHREDTFHVAVYAPLEEKIKRLRELVPNEPDPAALAEETDERRAAYVRRYFEEDWRDHRLYHLVINGSVGIGAAAEAILVSAGLIPNQP